MQTKKTVVLGASEKTDRYSNMAVRRLRAHGHATIAIGNKAGVIGDTEIITEHPVLSDVDTVTLYLRDSNQRQFYDYILSLHPKRIIFNPGAENTELQKMAEERGIETMEACTLVLLSTGQY